MSNKKPSAARSSTGPVIALVVVGVAMLGLMVYAGVTSGNKTPGYVDPNVGPCTPSPVKADSMPGVERVPCKYQRHVPDNQDIVYETNPPLSGSHYDLASRPGFYKSPQTEERLVHSLEHGNVVIYYNKNKLSAQELDHIEKVTKTFSGAFDGVIAVPRDEEANAIVLTAWEHALRLPAFDQAKVDQFVDLFRGRGPENPVR